MAYEKPDIKALVAQGISGWEAGRLVLRENFARSRGRMVLSDREIKILEKAIRPEGQEVYTALAGMVRTLEQACFRTEITGLDIMVNMDRTSLFMLHILATDNSPLPFIKQRKLDQEALEALNDIHGSIIELFELLRADLVFLADVSRVLEIPEYTNIVNIHIYTDLKAYNTLLETLRGYVREVKESNLDIPSPIDIENVPPDKEFLKLWRDRIAQKLGKGWWRKGWRPPES